MQCLALPGESYSSLRYILDFREHVTREYLSYLDNPRGPAKPDHCTICFSVCLSVRSFLSLLSIPWEKPHPYLPIGHREVEKGNKAENEGIKKRPAESLSLLTGAVTFRGSTISYWPLVDPPEPPGIGPLWGSWNFPLTWE